MKMDNFGWSIALVPGTPLIIGDTLFLFVIPGYR